MPVTALNALPFVIGRKNDNPVPEQRMIWFCRIPTMIFGILLGVFIFRWSRRLYGIQGGLFSLFLYVFCPNVVAHARLATTDVYCCFFIFISLYAFREYARHKTSINLIQLSVVVGMAQLTKQTALLLFPILLVLSMLEAFNCFARPLHLTKRLLYHSLLFVFVVLLIINLGYFFKGSFSSLRDYRDWFQLNNPEVATMLPQARAGAVAACLDRTPIPLPRAYVEGLVLGKYCNATGKGHGPVYLLGELSQYGHWYYFLTAFFLKTPLPAMALLAAAIWTTFKSRQNSVALDETALLVTSGVIFLFFSFCTTAQLGIRYILPMYPFLYVFLGKIAAREMTRFKSGIVAGLLIYLVVSFMSYYPHYISYFNELCWDRTKLYKYLADSNLDWGQDDNYLFDYLKRHTHEDIEVNPIRPVSGKVIVGANDLVGVTQDASTYKWLRDSFEPVGHIAYSWLYYEIPDK